MKKHFVLFSGIIISSCFLHGCSQASKEKPIILRAAPSQNIVAQEVWKDGVYTLKIQHNGTLSLVIKQ